MKWEYKTIKMTTHTTFNAGKPSEGAFDRAMNELGEQGWELVAVFPLTQTIGETRDVVVAFKRQLGQ